MKSLVSEGCVTLERKDVDEVKEPISRDEVERCVRKLKNGKAAGPDQISYELCKNEGEAVTDRMSELFYSVGRKECRKTGMYVE